VEHTSEDITVAVEEARQAPASPEDAVLQQEMHVAIRQALLCLPTRLRAPAILRFCHEVPHRDIAQHLNLTPETVRKRIQQARVLLQEQLHASLDGTYGPDWGDNEPVASALTCWHIDAPAA
jgi:RNA polymerase sigma factor (sigma-70 family)